MAERESNALKRPELDVVSGNAQAELSWDDIAYSGTITGWRYRYGVLDGPTGSVDWGEWTAIAGADGETRAFTLTGLVNDTEYGVQLRAVAGETLGEMSERQTMWPYHPWIEDAAVTGVTATTVGLEWTLPDGVTPTGLRVQKRTAPPELEWGEWQDAAELALDATSHTVTGLSPATRYQFRIVLDSATGGTESELLEQETPAAVLDTKMSGSASEDQGRSGESALSPERSVESGGEQGCAVEVTVAFLDEDGEAVAVDALAASDFTAENGRVRLPATERWRADEQVFYNQGAGGCAPAARWELADLRVYDLRISPPFTNTGTSYTSETMDADALVDAEAVYADATVTIAPADAEEGSVVLRLEGPGANDAHERTEGVAPYSLYGDTSGGANGRAEHGRALAAGSYTLTATAYAERHGHGETLGTLTVSFTVAVEAASPSAGVLTGFTLVDVSDQSTVAALLDGAEVDLGARFAGSFGIRANVASNATVGSVALSLTGAKTVSRTENIAPYSLWGDVNCGAGSALHGAALPAGSYTLSATAYAQRSAGGAVLGTRTVSFDILAPAALSVADASAEEVTDATLDFAVTLDREAAHTVTVPFAAAAGLSAEQVRVSPVARALNPSTT